MCRAGAGRDSVAPGSLRNRRRRRESDPAPTVQAPIVPAPTLPTLPDDDCRLFLPERTLNLRTASRVPDSAGGAQRIRLGPGIDGPSTTQTYRSSGPTPSLVAAAIGSWSATSGGAVKMRRPPGPRRRVHAATSHALPSTGTS